MSGTPRTDVAALVMAGVFEPPRSRFPRGFGRTGPAAPLAPIATLEPVRSVLVWAFGRRPHDFLVPTPQVVIPISPPGGPERSRRRRAAGRPSRERLAGMSPIRLQPSLYMSASGQSQRATNREASYAHLAGSRSPSAVVTAFAVPTPAVQSRPGDFYQATSRSSPSRRRAHAKTRPHSLSKKHAADGF